MLSWESQLASLILTFYTLKLKGWRRSLFSECWSWSGEFWVILGLTCKESHLEVWPGAPVSVFFKSSRENSCVQWYLWTFGVAYLWRPFQLFNSILFKVCKGFIEKKMLLEYNIPMTGGVWFYSRWLVTVVWYGRSHVLINPTEWMSRVHTHYQGLYLCCFVHQQPNCVFLLLAYNFINSCSHPHGNSLSSCDSARDSAVAENIWNNVKNIITIGLMEGVWRIFMIREGGCFQNEKDYLLWPGASLAVSCSWRTFSELSPPWELKHERTWSYYPELFLICIFRFISIDIPIRSTLTRWYWIS